jgi:hypothetical protein
MFDMIKNLIEISQKNQHKNMVLWYCLNHFYFHFQFNFFWLITFFFFITYVLIFLINFIHDYFNSIFFYCDSNVVHHDTWCTSILEGG